MYIESPESIRLLNKNRERLKMEAEPEFRNAEWRRKLHERLLKHEYAYLLDKYIKEAKIGHRQGRNYTPSANRQYEHISDHTLDTIKGKRIAVYTCVIGDYDDIREPLYINPEIDYIIFTDQAVSPNSKWQKRDVTDWLTMGMAPTVLNRKIKLMPYEYMSDYDYWIYIDGWMQIVADVVPLLDGADSTIVGLHTHADRDCAYLEGYAAAVWKKANKADIKKQLRRYRAEGFPEHYGLFMGGLLVRKNKPETNELMEKWWFEYQKDKTRDQISLPYVMWKNQIDSTRINNLGFRVTENERIKIYTHK